MIEVCLKQRLMGYFFKMFVSSADLDKCQDGSHYAASSSAAAAEVEDSKPVTYHPWLEVCEKIPYRHK